MARTLLLIEDEELLCTLIAKFLEDFEEIDFLSYEQDGLKPMKRVLEEQPEILVVDIRLPEMNGLEIITMVNRKLPGTKVVIFTGTVDEEAICIALRHGADGFVEKSFGLEELSIGLRKVLEDGRHFSPGILRLIRNFQIAGRAGV